MYLFVTVLLIFNSTLYCIDALMLCCVFIFIFLLKIYSNIFLLLCLTLCQWFLNKVVLAWLNMEFCELGFIWGNADFGVFAHWLTISGSRGCCWFRNRKKTPTPNEKTKSMSHVSSFLKVSYAHQSILQSFHHLHLRKHFQVSVDLVFKHIQFHYR